MSLRGFHVLFITASVLLALWVSKWCLPAHPVGAAFGRACIRGCEPRSGPTHSEHQAAPQRVVSPTGAR